MQPAHLVRIRKHLSWTREVALQKQRHDVLPACDTTAPRQFTTTRRRAGLSREAAVAMTDRTAMQ
jgi:hypothetical protein